ncbi:MAG: UPF0182 family protein [Candidatus Phosphoribacter sp.]
MDEQKWYASDPDGPAGGQPPPTRPQAYPRRRSPLGMTLSALAVLAIILSAAAQVWTEVLWFDSVKLRSVFTTQLGAQALLGIVGGLITAVLVWSSLYFGHRSRPIYAPSTPAQDALDRYREALEPIRRLATLAIPVLAGIVTGVTASGQWETFLLWRNAQPFGVTDPNFGMDVGFFVFTLPWLTFVVGFLTLALIFGAAAAAFTHYIYGGLQLANRGRDTTRFALLHLSSIFAAIILLRAAGYWLERYSLALGTSDLMTGIQYTDANAVLPTKAILAVASIMCALMFLSVIWTRSWRLPVIGTVLLVVVSVVVGGIFPALIQSLRVNPSEKSLEAPYIANNITATRAAYGLDAIEVTPYAPTSEASAENLRATAAAIPGIRIVDPNVVSPTVRQKHAARNYYAFPDALDVDRYTINGTQRDVVVAVRELDLDGVPAAQRNWLNDRTVYTHGYGFVAAYANEQDAEGNPVYVEAEIPAGKALGEYEPRIYFGEQSPAYSIVGAAEGAAPREFDYPAQVESQQVNNTYAGSGGVEVGSTLRRLAYGIKYREINFMLSDGVNAQSRILDYRTPKERVARVAPWLTLDGNAYPSIVDGRILWIIDGYTTTANYPNSRITSMAASTSDSTTRTRRSVTSLEQGQLNYIRNSVKATVDAFDGSVHLYTWDDTDPILKAWQGAFPGVVEPRQNISASLMSHLRYPEDLFKIQRNQLAKYHVENADSFYGGQDFWRVPLDPTQEAARTDQPPYYLSVAMPGQATPEFSLTTTFMPQGNREILTGFLAVDSNPGSKGEGERREGYGKLQLLELPPTSSVKGPGQVQNDIASSNQASKAFTLTLSQFINNARQQGSVVTLGNLLTLPMGGGMLYVEPIYVQGTASSQFPLGRAIVVAFGNKLAWSNTIDGALNELFGGQVVAPTTPSAPSTPTTPTPPGTTPTAPTTPSVGDPAALAAAIADAQTAFAQGETALKAGDFTAYGEAQKRLKDALARAAAASPTGSITVTPAPTATG